MFCIFLLVQPEQENAGQENFVSKSRLTEEIFDQAEKLVEVTFNEEYLQGPLTIASPRQLIPIQGGSLYVCAR